MKRICSVLLCLALLSPPALAASEGSWPAWAEPALSWGQDKSIGSEFLSAPAAVVTRGAAAQLLYEAAGRPDVSAACPFSDVSGAYADAVTWAAERGYLSGTGDGDLPAPPRLVTRQEFAAILWRQAGSPWAAAQDLTQFQDAGAVAEWARVPVLWSLQAGVMSGRSEDQLAPTGTITTAEALVMLRQADACPSVAALQTDLEALTATHRPVGSRGRQPPRNI